MYNANLFMELIIKTVRKGIYFVKTKQDAIDLLLELSKGERTSF
jgi:hypothetical protein